MLIVLTSYKRKDFPCTSLVAQMVNNLPAIQENQVQYLDQVHGVPKVSEMAEQLKIDKRDSDGSDVDDSYCLDFPAV